jgi:ABC-2 type transport system permease protein
LIFFLVYVVTSVSFLRERSLGTLERLMASPLRRTEIVVGYMLGFTLVALVQAAIILGFGLGIVGLYNAGSVVLLYGIEVLLAQAAVNLGIFLSTFARTEFQAVQFIPLVIVPQLLLSGLLVPVSSEPEWLQWISNVLPLTYAVDALRDVMLRGADLASSSVQLDLAVLGGFCVLVVLAAAATLRREVA